MTSETEIIQSLHQAVLEGDAEAAVRAAKEGLKAGIDPLILINKGGTPAIREVGKLFGNFEIYLPELILSADAMKAATEILMEEASRSSTGRTSEGRVVIGTAKGDIHDIGKNLVSALLSANGFEVIDLGVDVENKEFWKKAKAERADIIGISALMSTSAYYQEQVIELLKDVNCREDYFVIVGGGPTTPEWAIKIGADGYGRTAADAVNTCLELMAAKSRENLSEPIIMG